MKKLLLITSVFILSLATIYCQVENPMAIAKKVFSKDTLSDYEKYSTGEYEGKPNGSSLSDYVTTSFSLLGQTENTAVVNLTIIDSSEFEYDTYLHFKFDSSWKIYAFRALAMTGLYAYMDTFLNSLSEKQIDSIINISRNDTSKRSEFKTREEFEYMKKNISLVLASDNGIISHFIKYKKDFEDVKNRILDERKTSNLEENEVLKKFLEREAKKLFVDHVTIDQYKEVFRIEFLIGGILDNSVGYLFIPDKNDVPKMTPGNYIMIKEIGNGWYIFKTT